MYDGASFGVHSSITLRHCCQQVTAMCNCLQVQITYKSNNQTVHMYFDMFLIIEHAHTQKHVTTKLSCKAAFN